MYVSLGLKMWVHKVFYRFRSKRSVMNKTLEETRDECQFETIGLYPVSTAQPFCSLVSCFSFAIIHSLFQGLLLLNRVEGGTRRKDTKAGHAIGLIWESEQTQEVLGLLSLLSLDISEIPFFLASCVAP